MIEYRTKPVVIEAVQWNESRATLRQIGVHPMSCTGHVERIDECTQLRIKTPTGTVNVERGDWIIKGANGFSVCEPDIFEATYEPVEE